MGTPMKRCPVCDKTYEQGTTCECGGTLVPVRSDPFVGRTLKQTYEICEKVGTGAMGAVYRATQKPLGRSVAVKLLRNQTGDEGMIKRFFQEAKTLSQLSHPNIVNVIDFGNTEDGLAYMVMEFLEGGTLDSLVTDGRGLTLPFAHGVMEQVCAGLGAAHGQGFVHRDLKPGNVFIARMSDGSQVVKILDFGLAKVLTNAGEARLTVAGMLMGTPGYIAPEQIADPAGADARADIYALGALLVFMLTGRDAYSGDSMQQTLAMQIAAAPNLGRIRELGLPPALEGVILTVMDPDPSKRLQNTDEVLQAMRQATGLSISRLPMAEATQLPDGPSDSQLTRQMTPSELRDETRKAKHESGQVPRHESKVVPPSGGFLADDSVDDASPPGPKTSSVPSDGKLKPFDDPGGTPMTAQEIAEMLGEKPPSLDDSSGSQEAPAEETAAPSFDFGGGGLRDEGDTAPKPGTSNEPDAAASAPPEPGVTDSDVDMFLDAPVIDKGEGDLGGALINPHSSGDVPLIPGAEAAELSAGLLPPAQDDFVEQDDDFADEEPSDVQPTIDPNANFEPLRLMPDRPQPKRRSSAVQPGPQAAQPDRTPSGRVAAPAGLGNDTRLLAMAGGGAALVVALLGWFFLSGSGPKPTPPPNPAKVAAESAEKGSLSMRRGFDKLFGTAELSEPGELAQAQARHEAGSAALQAGKFEEAKAAFAEASGLYKQARESAKQQLARSETEVKGLVAKTKAVLERVEQIYDSPDLVDRGLLIDGQGALERATTALGERKFVTARKELVRAEALAKEAEAAAYQALGGKRAQSTAAREKALATRQKFHSVYDGTDLDKPAGLDAANKRIDDGREFERKLRFESARLEFIDAQLFYSRALSRVESQLASLRRSYEPHSERAAKIIKICQPLIDSGRIDPPASWREGTEGLAAAKQSVANGQHKEALKRFAASRQTLEKARAEFNKAAEQVAVEQLSATSKGFAAAKAKYEPTDVPPPPAMREGEISLNEGEGCVNDKLYIDALEKFDTADGLFKRVLQGADGHIAEKRREAEAALAAAKRQRAATVARIRGREQLPGEPDKLAAEGAAKLAARQVIAARKTFEKAELGFKDALIAFETRLALKKDYAEKVLAKANAAATAAQRLGTDAGSDEASQGRDLIARGKALFPAEKFDEARDLFDKATVRFRAAEAVGHIARGARSYAENNYSKAIASFNDAVRLDPSNAKGWFNRGITRYAMKSYSGAKSDLDKAIGLDKDDAQAYYCRGLVLVDSGSPRDSLRDFEKAVELDSSLWRAHYQRGDALAGLNRRTEALAALKAALDGAPADERAQIQTRIQQVQQGR